MIEEIKYLTEQNAEFMPQTAAPGASGPLKFELINASLAGLKASPIPENLAAFYKTYQMAVLGDAVIFPIATARRGNYEIPGIPQINEKFSAFVQCRGKVIWGRNSLYIFSADISGTLYIHDVLTLQTLKTYTDFGSALTDCLMVGKV